MSSNATANALWLRLTPAVFVLLWSTGFIGAKFGLPYAGPFSFLSLRLALVSALLVVIALISRAPWPHNWRQAGHIALAGLLVHGIYLGGVFAAIDHGLPAGLVALVVGMQPLLTAAGAATVLGERVSRLQWLGLLLGLAGLIMVVAEKLSLRGDLTGLGLAVAALLGITVGTLYQKKFCTHMDLRTGTALQYLATLPLFIMIAQVTETRPVLWTGSFVFALLWLTLVLSVGAIFLLFILIRRGQAARVASLFYLTPPFTAVIAWALFGEILGPLALAGMVVVALGVALAQRRN